MNKLEVIKETEVLDKQFSIYGSVEEPLFLAKDVADWIEHSNVSSMINAVDEDEKELKQIGTLNNAYSAWFLTEDGLYEVLMQSRKPIAKQFKKQIKKILKDIRLYGKYEVPATYADALLLAAHQQKLIDVQNQLIGEYKPKVDYMDRILKSKSLVTITQIAKDYGMSGQALNKLLHKLGVQYKQSDQWLLYHKHQAKGYTHSETVVIEDTHGLEKTVMNTKWTQKGRLFLYNLLRDNGVLPTIEAEG